MENLVTRILITGVGGFIGSNLAEHFYSKDYEVIGLDRVSNVEVEQKISKFIVADLKICDESIITDNKIDYIVHCAGIASVDLHNTSENTDYLATQKLLNLSKVSKVKKLIFLSSNKADGEDNYSKSKREMEFLIKKELASSNIAYTFLRSSIVYGRGMGSNISTWLKMIEKSAIPALPASSSRILMISVLDLCKCIEKCITNSNTDNKAYVVSDGIPYSINEIELTARRTFNKPAKYLVCPRFLIYIMSKIGDLMIHMGIGLPINSRIYTLLFRNTAYLSHEFEKDTGFKASTTFYTEIPSIFLKV